MGLTITLWHKLVGIEYIANINYKYNSRKNEWNSW